MSRATRVGQLLRRFKLTPQASAAELRTAYLKQAKVLHPDVAGKSSEEQFRQLKEEYEEAMRLMREHATTPSSSSTSSSRPWPPQGQQGYYQGWTPPPPPPHWGSQSRGPDPYQPPPTAAQRLRNVLLAAIGVGAGVLVLSRRGGVRDQERARAAHSIEGLAPGAVASGGAGGEGFEKRPSKDRRQVPEYYKSRTSKSTVRVRGGDTYVSPESVPKSRSGEEGLGASIAAVSCVARGASPSAARPSEAQEASAVPPPPPPPPPLAAAPATATGAAAQQEASTA